jgi:hypothetical protein
VVLALVEEEAGLLPPRSPRPGARRPRSPRPAPAPRRAARRRSARAPRASHLGSLRSTCARLQQLDECFPISVGPLGPCESVWTEEVVACSGRPRGGQPIALAVDDAIGLGPAATVPRSAARARSGRAGKLGARATPRSSMRAGSRSVGDQSAMPSGSPRRSDAHERAGGSPPPSFTTSLRKHPGCPRSTRAGPCGSRRRAPRSAWEAASIPNLSSSRGVSWTAEKLVCRLLPPTRKGLVSSPMDKVRLRDGGVPEPNTEAGGGLPPGPPTEKSLTRSHVIRPRTRRWHGPLTL